MQQWEYKILEACTIEDGIYVINEDGMEPEQDELVVQALRRLGLAGWELVEIPQVQISDRFFDTLYFKRPI